MGAYWTNERHGGKKSSLKLTVNYGSAQGDNSCKLQH